MDNFIIEEFKNYKVFLFDNHAPSGLHASIRITIPSGHAELHFVSKSQKNTVADKAQKKIFNVYIDADRYSDYIDLLRNEGPLFFYYNFENNTSLITTSEEPVGEGE